MTSKPKTGVCLTIAAIAILLAPGRAAAERTVHWQVSPQGFPAKVPVFIDAEENGAFLRSFTAASFAVSVDEYAGEQGGWILNRQQVAPGTAGAQVLIMIDKSRSYTGEWENAKKVMKAIVGYLDPGRDQIAIGTFPAEGGFADAKLDVGFTNNKNALTGAIDSIRLMSDDKTGARLCSGLAEALKWFPDNPSDRYRVIVLVTGGADKGEGKGDCVDESFRRGKVPFYTAVFKLDRKYDDPRNSHEIENKTHDLAQATGGRSIFRRAESENLQFVSMLWSRIRSQYLLQVMFPCYRPMPAVEHVSVLKVDGKDVDGIKFQATSTAAPVPQVTAVYPPSATRKDVDDGKVDITVDGSGFCGPPGSVKVAVNGVPLAIPRSQNPFRVVSPLSSAVDTGTITLINQFGMQAESAFKFQVVAAPRGAEASSALTGLVIGLVGLAVLAVILVSLRSRKAKVKPVAPAPAASSSSAAPRPAGAGQGGAQKTVALSALSKVTVTLADGSLVDLDEGPNLIGREAACRIRIDVVGVSREHARIDVERGRGMVWIEDLGSTNGTFVGPATAADKDLARLTQRRLLMSGEVILVGGQRLAISFASGPTGGRED
ncbi:MAG: FHA domain-containing protein [Deltaproteobacteria bacterium]|nr:FHA domain-containing protein [Deltaproteobacteria bacterium]